MPYKIEKRGDQWCVIKEADSKSMGCHPTEGAAKEQQSALHAEEKGEASMTLYATDQHPSHVGRWVVADLATHNVMAQVDSKEVAYQILASAYDWGSLTAAADEGSLTKWKADPAIGYVGTPTGDKRQIDKMEYRSFPQPLMLKTHTSMGHEGAIIAGRVDEASDDGAMVSAHGVFDSSPTGAEAERLVRNQMLTGVSMDPGSVDVEMEILDVDEDGFATDYLARFTKFEMAGLTICPVPAFADAAIVCDEGVETETVVASINASPPPEWFHDPEFTEATPIRVSDEGHIRGHIATWGVCHIGKTGQCVTAPHSKTEYSLFATGYFQCEDGCEIPTGVVTIGGGHAGTGLSLEAVRRHYDESGVAAADVAIGEDDFGIWISGACRSNVTAEQIRELRAHSPSGDWRGVHGNLELVAILAVNVPGFPVVRTRSEAGVQLALIASLGPREVGQPILRTKPTVEERLALIERYLAPKMVDQLGADLGLAR